MKIYPDFGGIISPVSNPILQEEIKNTFLREKTLKDKI